MFTHLEIWRQFTLKKHQQLQLDRQDSLRLIEALQQAPEPNTRLKSAWKFYLRVGFQTFLNESSRLFLPMKTIEKLIQTHHISKGTWFVGTGTGFNMLKTHFFIATDGPGVFGDRIQHNRYRSILFPDQRHKQ